MCVWQRQIALYVINITLSKEKQKFFESRTFEILMEVSESTFQINKN